MQRPVNLCRSWMFVAGGDETALSAATKCDGDVLIQELEDFTPPELRPKARALAPNLYDQWRNAGKTVAVRINPINDCGMEDLEAVMKAKPDIVALPKVSEPDHVAALDKAVAALEKEYGLPIGSTKLLPNIELARGLVQTGDIARASDRVIACLMASEDLAADLGAERSPDGKELEYCRQRFLVECVAANTIAIDCPFTWANNEGLERDVNWARKLGYKAKSCVVHDHTTLINNALTPSPVEIETAEKIVTAFESARRDGQGRAEFDGALVEMPKYMTACRLLARAQEFSHYERSR